MEYVTLNNGIKMPIIGFGVFELTPEETERCVLNAIDCGYRSFDTAQAYYNEEYVGNAVKKAIESGKVKREELFITTKVWVTEFSYEKARASILESLKKLQLEYIDLVLIHQCLSDYYSAYHAMEDLYKEGKIKAIGISNFSAERMNDIYTFNEIKPAVNQVETHMFFQQHFLNEWMKKLGIQHEAWGPLAQHRVGDVINNPIVKEIANNHKKTPVQISLRYNVQRGIVVIPKAREIERMKQNIDIFDFKLTPEEMEKLKTLDENKSLWLEYDDPSIVQMAMS